MQHVLDNYIYYTCIFFAHLCMHSIFVYAW